MRARTVMAAGAAAALAAHAVPLVTTRASLRRRYLPQLAGLGSPDHIALTFDDGPDPGTTPHFLEALDRLGMHATFFMLGVNAELHRSVAAEVAAAGHEVAAHGYHHRSQLFTPPGRVRDDILRGIHTVAEATGQMPRWYRPPFGTLSNAGLLAAQRFGLRTVLWSAWGKDWSEKATPDTVLAELDKDLGPGVTVLLHDSDCASAPGSWKAALGALDGVADRVSSMGLTVGPLADHGIAA